MIPSVEACKTHAAGLLGDPTQRKFTSEKLQPAFELAYEELTGEMARNHLRKQKRIVTYALTSGVIALLPVTAGISNFGELILMEERGYGSSGLYTKVTARTSLPQRYAVDLLMEYEWSNDEWHFIGATQDIDLRISYYDSGAAPTTGSVGIDGSKNFLAYRTAAIAGFPAGNKDMARDYDKMARGPRLDNDGGFIFSLIQAQVTAEQSTQLQLPYFRAGNWMYLPGAPGLLATGGGGGGVSASSTVIPSGTMDGVNDTFTLATAPLHLTLFLNGICLAEGIGYTLAGGTITMLPGYIPQSDSILRAEVW